MVGPTIRTNMNKVVCGQQHVEPLGKATCTERRTEVLYIFRIIDWVYKKIPRRLLVYIQIYFALYFIATAKPRLTQTMRNGRYIYMKTLIFRHWYRPLRQL
jgi:hypothetical protein